MLGCMLAVGCYDPKPANECDGVACDAAPQVDSTIDGLPDGCGATTCSNSTLSVCGQVQVCNLGCASGGAVRCNDVLPSNNVSDWDLADATLPLDIATGTINVNTDTGLMINASNNATLRPAGTGVRNGIFFGTGTNMVGMPGAVFAMRDLRVRVGVALRFTGSKPVALLIDGNADIEGVLDVSADLGTPFTPGAGGGTGAQQPGVNGTGCGGGKAGVSVGTFDGGGGGAGFRQGGAVGGVAGADTTTPGGGGPVCLSTDLQPLIAGSGGGAGGGASQADTAGFGGAGGGALQVSVREGLVISSTGRIAANGGGGGGGRSSVNSGGGAGGGGSGGGVLVEAAKVVVGGGIFANGGGGGGGASGAAPGAAGATGGQGSIGAPGGMGAVVGDSGDGGTGGNADTPMPGGPGTSNGGGGGGASGRIVIRSYTAVNITGAVSPMPVQLPLQLQ